MDETQLLPTSGRIVGVDFGTVRIGVAISDPGQTLSSPLDVYNRRSKSLDAKYFQELVGHESLAGFVVGLPIHTNGDESEKSRQARNFSKWLRNETSIPVVMFDERFTTSMARQLLNQSTLSGKKRKERLDKIAAHVLLTAFLEARDKAVAVDFSSTNSNQSIEDKHSETATKATD